MAESQPNPAQHLQWQQQQQHQQYQPKVQPHPQSQPQPQLQSLVPTGKCRHVHCSESSWSVGWRRFAWLLAVVCLLTRPVMPEVIYRVDPLALLAATLRTYQRAGCDSEQLSLSCPRGTSISIELAQYGRAGGFSSIFKTVL